LERQRYDFFGNETLINMLFFSHETSSYNVIAGLTRNLLNERLLPLHLGDGGCSSAMTLKGEVSH
jgi:hypothetical protein